MADLRAALSIAGSDPTGGAGLQLDLQVFAAHGVHGMAVPTALTVQSTKGVERVFPVFPNVFADQLSTLLSDIRPDAIKIGVLGTDDLVLRLAGMMRGWDVPRVVDPVLEASDGSWLLERRAWVNLMDRIVAGAALVTPNRGEALQLTGEADPEAAARAFLAAGAHAALIKGGHAEGAPDDFLLTRDGGTWIRGRRLEGAPVHGTGCALSSAIAARLARGEAIADAVRGAKRFVENAIDLAAELGSGQRILGVARAKAD